MKIVFMGCPQFAVPSLEMLAKDSRFKLLSVYCMPDKPQGRGKKLEMTPIKRCAVELGIQVHTPFSFSKCPEEIAILADYQPDYIVVVAYGLILPESVLKIPKIAAINLHASILPSYRGPSPIHAAIINGDSHTGNTVMLMNKKMDQGDILAVQKIEISESSSFSDLHDNLSLSGAKLLTDTLVDFSTGKIKPVQQDHSKASYTKKITPETGKINFSEPAYVVERLVRALAPSPGAWFLSKNERIKIGKALVLDDFSSAAPGNILSADTTKGLKISCGKNTVLEILSCQRPGKLMLPTKDFLRGYSFNLDENLNCI
ncbi:MAG: methionyl-tRNA formyltransferase [Candidatus Riflebacteria bacterium]|nr:methionyl-tRNA formyltransferase [Candidatus Riflebacteria bacterium]